MFFSYLIKNMIVKNLFEYKQQKCKMLRCCNIKYKNWWCYVLNDVFMIIMYHFMVLYLVFLSMCGTESMGENGVYVLYFYLCVSLKASVLFNINLFQNTYIYWWFGNFLFGLAILSLVCFVSTSFSKQCQIKGEAWDSRCDKKSIFQGYIIDWTSPRYTLDINDNTCMPISCLLLDNRYYCV